MADFDDDIDFRHLAKEISSALAKDEKYQRENDAKFRAIHQKVKSYDEFRDIVEASHLKPLDKTDKIGGMSYQTWNQMASNAINMQEESRTDMISPKSFDQPTNSHEFSKVWKRRCPDDKSRFVYLLSIDPERLKKCLEGDCLLGEIVCVLHSSIDKIADNTETIVNILEIISSANRFSLSLNFLSSKEQEQLQVVFDALNSSLNQQHSDLLNNICASYKMRPK